MDSFDINTRLPPRKRLLAGMRKEENSDGDFSLPVPFISSDLSARLHDVVNSTTSSPEEIVEAAKSVALAAAEAATAARAAATEKAAAAAKARSAAKTALELLDAIARSKAPEKGCATKTKSRKKHVAVKLLYADNRPVQSQEVDEDLARRLHRAINSSPRISSSKQKKLVTSGSDGFSDDGIVCSGNPPVFGDEVIQLAKGCSAGKLEGKVVVCSKADSLERGEEEYSYFRGKHYHGSKANGVGGGRIPKIKQKKLPLSKCNIRDQEEHKKAPTSVDNSVMGGSNLDHARRKMPLNRANDLEDNKVSMKITSMWKCKKFKVAQCASDSKTLPSQCPNPSTTNSSAMVKVD